MDYGPLAFVVGFALGAGVRHWYMLKELLALKEAERLRQDAVAVDAALGLVQLPPIRIGATELHALEAAAEERGLALQAFVRAALYKAAKKPEPALGSPLPQIDWPFPRGGGPSSFARSDAGGEFRSDKPRNY